RVRETPSAPLRTAHRGRPSASPSRQPQYWRLSSPPPLDRVSMGRTRPAQPARPPQGSCASLVLLLLLCRRWRCSRLLALDPPPNLGLQHRQGQSAAAEHGVVELADVEFVAQRFLRFRTQLLDRDHADLVAGRLPGPEDVALDLRLDRLLRLRRVGLEV